VTKVDFASRLLAIKGSIGSGRQTMVMRPYEHLSLVIDK
jgi:hypothetical protein